MPWSAEPDPSRSGGPDGSAAAAGTSPVWVASVGATGMIDGGAVVFDAAPVDPSGLAPLNKPAGFTPFGEDGSGAAVLVGASLRAFPSAGTPTGGTSDAAMRAGIARQAYGVSGAGVTVGLLSDSFNVLGGAGDDIAIGNLPAAGVNVLREGPLDSIDEGRSMAELVHKAAPGAALAFYSGGWNESDMANGIRALAAAGARVIVDDIGWFSSPFYQDGSPVQQAIHDVVAQGASYFTSAGNNGRSYYESAFTPIAVGLPGLSGTWTAHNFSAGGTSPYETLTIPRGELVTVAVQWDQSFRSIGAGIGAQNRLAVILFNPANGRYEGVAESSLGGDPVAGFTFYNTSNFTSYSLIVLDTYGSPPGKFKVLVDSVYGTATINDVRAGTGSGTIFGQALNTDANVVAAVDWANTPAYGRTPIVETFSSYGPGILMFDSSGSRLPITQTLNAIDFAAPDGTATSVLNPFYGTSAASPNAAAVGALMLEARGNLTPADVTTLLTNSTVAMASSVQSGAGLIQADLAVGYAATLVFNAQGRTSLTGTHLNDSFISGSGNHTLAGGAGVNSISYASATGNVFLNLGAGTASNPGGVDLISGFQVVAGSSFNDSIVGGSGNETLVATTGFDTLNGSTGIDVADFSRRTVGITASLATGLESDSSASATLVNIEGIVGSSFNDALTGDAGANWLSGGNAGRDTLTGGAGNDTLLLGSGASTVVLAAGDGQDQIVGFKSAPGGDTLSLGGPALSSATASLYGGPAVLTAGANGVVTAVYRHGLQATWGTVTPGAIGTIGASDGQGHAEVLWQDPVSGGLTLWTVNPSGGAPIATAKETTGSGWSVAGSADFDGNGSSDFLFYNANSRLYYMWLQNGATTISQGIVTEGGGGWTVGAIGDFDADGKSDLLLRNGFTGDTWAWRMSGTAILESREVAVVSTSSTLIGAADLNGDGRAEALWRNSDGSVTSWVMNGTLRYSSSNIAGAGSVASGWSLAGIGDLSGDGVADIAWQTGPSSVVAWLGGNPANTMTIASSTTIGGAIGTGNFFDSTQLGFGATGALMDGLGVAAVRDVSSTVASWSFLEATSAVTVDALAGSATVGGAVGVMSGTGSVTGSDFGDTLYAGPAMRLDGGAGGDTLVSGSGADTLDGGAGFDQVSYARAGAGVTINLATGSFGGVYAAGDTLANVEAIVGSRFADALTGDAGANWLSGGGGDDAIDGGGGNDTLFGTAGAATLSGGAGNDLLVAGAGATRFAIAAGEGLDQIEGFKLGTGGDTLALGGVAAGSTTAGLYVGPSVLTLDGLGTVSVVYGDGTQAAWGSVAPGAKATVGASDGKGRAEVLWQDAAGNLTLWTRNATGGAPVVTALGQAGAGWAVVGSGDLDGNGSSDFLFQNATSGLFYAWLMDGAQTIAAGVVTQASLGWKLGAVGDLDGDGKSDVLLRNALTGDTWAWKMSGLSIVGSSEVAFQPAGATLLGAADFSGDGRADAIWRNTDGSVVSWAMNGTTRIGTTSIASAGTVASTWSFVGLADVNSDGRADLSWQLPTGSVQVWLAGSPTNTLTIVSASTIAPGIGIGNFVDSALIGTGGGSGVVLGGLGLPSASQVLGGLGPLSFAGATAAVSFSLADGALSIGGSAGDGMATSSVVGSGLGDVFAAGNGGSSIQAGGGADTMQAGAGGDTLDGGAGVDLVSYAGATSGIALDLSGIVASTGWAAGDVLVNVERIVGTAFADALTGDGGANWLSGGSGSGSGDTLVGGAGNDTLLAGSGPTRFGIAAGDGQDLVQGFKLGVDTLALSGIALGATTASAYWGPSVLTADALGTVSVVYGDGTQAVWGTVSPGAKATIGASDGNGRADVLWQDAAGNLTLWTRNATGGAPVATAKGQAGAGWSVAGSGDFDGNGSSDFVFYNANSGLFYAWLMNGATVAAAGILTQSAAGWVPGAIGDFDGDGKSDILVRNAVTGDTWAWRMNGLSIVGSGEVAFQTAGATLLGAADLNGDGRAEAIWRNADGSVVSWAMNGTTRTGTTTLASAGTVSSTWTLAGLGDVNGDGRADLAWQLPGGSILAWLGGSTSSTVTFGAASALAPSLGIGSFIDSTVVATGGGSSVTLGGLGLPATSQALGGLGTLGFANATAGVSYDLGTGTLSVGGIARDGVTTSRVVGSGFGDVFAAPSGGSSIQAGGGGDTMLAGAGGDTLDGGTGVDTVSYAGATSGVTLDLSGSIANVGWAAGDLLVNVERIVGSGFADALTGDGGANWLSGGGGTGDTLVGGAGNDTLLAGTGATRFDVAAGHGQDVVQGFKLGAGGDTLVLSGIAPGATTGVSYAGPAVLTMDALGTVSAVYGDGTQAIWGTVTPGAKATVGTVDGSGHAEVLWQDTTGNLTLWTRAAASGAPVATPMGQSGAGWSVAGSGDFDGNGSSDYLFYNANSGLFYAWLMSGARMIGAGIVTQAASGWAPGTIGDFDGDGKSDILVRNTVTGDTWAWKMSGLSITGSSEVAFQTVGATLLGAADLNGEGRAEAVWRNSNGSVVSWTMNGTTRTGTTTLAVSGTVPSTWTLAGLGDVNGDGRADLAWQQPSGSIVAWLGGSTSNTLTISGASTIASSLGVGSFIESTLVNTGGGSGILLSGVGSNAALQLSQPVGTWSFATLGAGVTADLAAGSWSVGGVAQGTLSAQSLIGSGFADRLTAGSAGSLLQAGGGADTLFSGVGADTLDGGSGIDQVSYANAPGGITVNLGSGMTAGSYAAGDVLTNVERIVGSAFDDVLTGDAGANWLAGGSGGHDLLAGGAGADTLTGGGGPTTIGGGIGNDLLVSGAGRARFTVSSGDGQDMIQGFKLGPSGDTLVVAGGGNAVTKQFYYDASVLTVDSAGLVTAVYSDGRQAAWGTIAPGATATIGAGAHGIQDSSVLWQDPAGNLTLWTPNTLSGAPLATAKGQLGAGWTVAGSGDFDGNGSSDYLFFNASSGLFYAWLLDGATTIGAGIVTQAAANWVPGAIGDFDGDHKADILVRNTVTRDTWAWKMDGLSITGSREVAFHTVGATLLGAADLNIDGRAEALWRNPDGSVTSWTMNGTTRTGTTTLASAGTVQSNWTYVGAADLNGDLRADLAWQTGSGSVTAWLTGNTASTVTIASASIGAPIAGIGSVVGSVRVAYGNGDGVMVGGVTGLAGVIQVPSGDVTVNGPYGGGPVIGGYPWSGGFTLSSNQGSDALVGSTGNDTFLGNPGNDTMQGFGGYDLYLFNRGDGRDVIENGVVNSSNGGNPPSASLPDIAGSELDFGSGIAASQLWLSRAGNDLAIQVMGTTDQVTISGWYERSSKQLDKIVAGDGNQLDNQLGTLVSAMATYSAANPGFDPTASPQAPADPTLQAVIAAAWHS